ncbi:HPr family phosphocarrier protein [Acetobacterium carbinolicum]|jgi:Phosphotransferase System HPr (HPr) Family|nr:MULTISPECIES: HPr family phosphocarrier protein [unclassified Acetobacterium]AWW27808.1 HPr family phosphocarrier protein [Acetobacterium sp. KB-1]MDK2941357.1 phosphocarrier protein HPr [Acetobacterium sp.]MDZ5726345.1 HPr family phosphocarrier protein [Acetobacterium sp. K1/6]
MHAKQVTIINPTGLHARPAAEFVQKAGAFRANIQIKKMDEDPATGDAKSLLGIMSIGLGQGDTIEISAEGEDEMLAVETLVALVGSGFGEV